MNKEEAFALARRMQAELPGTTIDSFPVSNGEYSVYAELPNGDSVLVGSLENWQDEKASYEATREFHGS